MRLLINLAYGKSYVLGAWKDQLVDSLNICYYVDTRLFNK